MGWLSLACLPMDLEGVKLWQQMAILLGILWLIMGIMWPATREVEHPPRPGGGALFVASCFLMGVTFCLQSLESFSSLSSKRARFCGERDIC